MYSNTKSSSWHLKWTVLNRTALLCTTYWASLEHYCRTITASLQDCQENTSDVVDTNHTAIQWCHHAKTNQKHPCSCWKSLIRDLSLKKFIKWKTNFELHFDKCVIVKTNWLFIYSLESWFVSSSQDRNQIIWKMNGSICTCITYWSVLSNT